MILSLEEGLMLDTSENALENVLDTKQTLPDSTKGRGDAAVRHRQVIAHYGLMRHLGIFRHNLDRSINRGERLVVRTPRGTELATAIMNVGGEGPWSIGPERLEEYLSASGPDYPINRHGKVLRIANPQDINDQMHLDKSARQEEEFCREQVEHLGMEMKIVTVEHLLGGERLIFYFTAQQRVDFRELVRRLASQYHTRIEMRQIGARDEARLVADYERCGQQCCCKEFLKLLRPVSMRMAKTQKATLDPTKISGRCGRLMCCLRYEDATYRELQEKLPGKNTWIKTRDGLIGKVVETQILTQLVHLSLVDHSQIVVPNEEIVERDLPAPSEEQVEQEPARKVQPVVSWFPVSIDRPVDEVEQKPATLEEDVERIQRETIEDRPDLDKTGQSGTNKRQQQAGERSGQKITKRRKKTKKHPGALTIAPRVHKPESGQNPVRKKKKKKRRR